MRFYGLKVTALNLHVHKSLRANNVTNIRDLSQELCESDWNSSAMLHKGKIQRGRYFGDGVRINKSLSAHKRRADW